jgi:hypothetical protein
MAFLLTVRSLACRIAVSKRLSWKYRLASCLKSDASGARTVERIRFYPSPRNLVPICHRPRRGTRRCRWHLTTFVPFLVSRVGRIYVSPGGFIVVGFVVFTSTTEAAAPHF